MGGSYKVLDIFSLSVLTPEINPVGVGRDPAAFLLVCHNGLLQYGTACQLGVYGLSRSSSRQGGMHYILSGR